MAVRSNPKRYSRYRTRDVVRREGNCIRFLDRVNALAHRQFMKLLYDCRREGYQDIVFDFSECELAFLNGMIPLLPNAELLRREGVAVSAKLPNKDALARLFCNTNWAHFLQPDLYPMSEVAHDRHLAAQRFSDSAQQQNLVNDFMDVVMRNMTLERDVIAGLEWSINEITDNVLNHAESAEGGIVQVSTFGDSRKVAFGVADSGRGILTSLREGHPSLQTDAQAIGEAMKAGITRNPDAGQGNGIAGALRIASMSEGVFEITSGLAQIVVLKDKARQHPNRQADFQVYERKEPQRYRGTVVYVEIGLDTRFHLSDALGFSGEPYALVDIIETQYETDSGDAVVLKLREESTGFGSRLAGRQLRTKCTNLLNAEPTKPLLLDWTAIPLVSSSFADELVGKLFASLGPLAFSARVRNVGMETIVRGLVDKAIMQRVAQVANDMTGMGDPQSQNWSEPIP